MAEEKDKDEIEDWKVYEACDNRDEVSFILI